MKKTLMILALVMFSFANAQKGTVLVMGNVGFTSQKQGVVGDKSTYDVVTFSPKVGYQFNDNWTVGVESSIVSSKNIFKNGEAKQNDFSLGSFIRYAKPIGEIFSAYVDLGAGFKNSKRSNYNEGDLPQDASTYIIKTNGFYIAATPAIFLDMNKGFGLNFNIGGLNYSSVKDNDSNAAEYKRFVFDFGRAFSIGLSKDF